MYLQRGVWRGGKTSVNALKDKVCAQFMLLLGQVTEGRAEKTLPSEGGAHEGSEHALSPSRCRACAGTGSAHAQNVGKGEEQAQRGQRLGSAGEAR